MNLCASRDFKYYLILVLLILVQQLECKRRGSGGGRRTGGSSHTTPRSHNYNTHNSGTGSNVDHHAHQTNSYQTNNNAPPPPSAPISPPSSNTNVGFEHFNQPHGSQGNRQDIGFENVHNRVPQQNNPPSSPIGFNVPQQNHQPPHTAFNVPQQNSQPPHSGFNVPQQNSQPPQAGFNIPQQNSQPPQAGFNIPHQNSQPPHSTGFNGPPNAGSGFPPNSNYPHMNSYPGGSNYNPQMNTGNYHPNYGQYGGNTAFNPHLQGGGYHNPNLAQPNSYYNPNFGVPGGAPPPIYQPVQQSSGSSFLGYAGSFAGGYLIGRLTSGGGGHDSNNQYTVHHYHHNVDGIPKKTSVSNNSLTTCSQNETQGLCVPNTFPICLVNGTIMCVTHSPYTVPCGQNQSMACVITVLPCVNGTNCNTTADNSTTTAVYIPCISNATLAKPTELQNMTLPGTNTTGNQTSGNNKVELCITAIAEPKKVESPAMSYFTLIEKLLEFPLDINVTSEMSFGNTQNAAANKSDVVYVTS